jgi:hypothetical protein
MRGIWCDNLSTPSVSEYSYMKSFWDILRNHGKGPICPQGVNLVIKLTTRTTFPRLLLTVVAAGWLWHLDKSTKYFSGKFWRQGH